MTDAYSPVLCFRVPQMTNDDDDTRNEVIAQLEDLTSYNIAPQRPVFNTPDVQIGYVIHCLCDPNPKDAVVSGRVIILHRYEKDSTFIPTTVREGTIMRTDIDDKRVSATFEFLTEGVQIEGEIAGRVWQAIHDDDVPSVVKDDFSRGRLIQYFQPAPLSLLVNLAVESFEKDEEEVSMEEDEGM